MYLPLGSRLFWLGLGAHSDTQSLIFHKNPIMDQTQNSKHDITTSTLPYLHDLSLVLLDASLTCLSSTARLA